MNRSLTGGHTYTVQVQYVYRGTYVHSTGTVRIQGDIRTQYRYSTCTGGHTYTVQVQYVYRGTYVHSTGTVRIQGDIRIHNTHESKQDNVIDTVTLKQNNDIAFHMDYSS